MTKVQSFTFNPFNTNTYIVWDDTNECVIIDAACLDTNEFDRVEKFLKAQQLKPVKLLCTHCHFDHILGNQFFIDKYGLQPIAHQEDDYLVDASVQHALMFGMKIAAPPKTATYVQEKDQIKFGNSSLDVLHVPGHSPGSIAFYDSENDNIFSGDVLFKDNVGRTDLQGGDHELLLESIKTKMYKLHPETTVYPGHGSSTIIGYEKIHNPFTK